ncbi:MAG TPA: haloacid dehalogenase type II [Pseudonocardiaceae bacterium]|jgi:2-haloacid dehalogenase|nr:haloacid dehalogenase type II [Pseudonocardiaceae bacterium]
MSEHGASVVAFDVYGTLIDPIGIAGEIDRTLAGGRGQELAVLWRAKQLEYSFRLTVMDTYQDFRWVTDRALRFAAASTGVELTDEAARHLVDCYDRLPAFADARPALAAIRADGHRPSVFSNGSPDMIARLLANSGLDEYIEQRVSVDAVRQFKPAPAAYQHAAGSLGVPIGGVTLVSCNAFDVVGANAAGMRTVWVNRVGTTYDTIGEAPDATITGLADLPAVLRRR